MIETIKRILQKYLGTLVYFYRHLRYRMIIMIMLGLLVGIMDGFGLAMFMPLLEMVGNNGNANGESLGNLDFIVKGIKSLGFSISLTTILTVMIVFFFIKGVVKFLSSVYNAALRRFFIVKLRKQLLAAFNNIKYKYFVISDVGRIQNTMSVEVERASGAFYNYANAVQQALLVIAYMGFAFIIDMRFSLLVIIGGALTNFLYRAIYKRTKRASRLFSKYSHLYHGQIIQYVSNFKYLKATSFLNNYSVYLIDSINRIENSRFRIGQLNAILQAAREPLLIFVVAGVILIQTQLLGGSLGPILISLLFFYRALTSLLMLQDSYNRFLEQSGSLENLREFQAEINQEKEKKGVYKLKGFKNVIKLRNASLAYESTNVLEEIDLIVKKDEIIAFIGESGSGKTTLVNVIAGLLPVDSGEMIIDGKNRNEVDIDTYQNKVGYITQDPVIFNDTVFNNVTLWDIKNQENIDRFKEAVKKASLDIFINELSNGFDSLIENDGVNLSGGQKQRISIARELYKDIDILIMDEATSALDSETENVIQESIKILKGDYTILMVAHRLSTIIDADRIVLMNKGRIEQIGTFSELIKSSRRFKKMTELQEL